MNFLAALFMTQLLYVVGAGGVQDSELCAGLAFSLQYMRTSVFCWLYLVTRQAFRGFGDDARLSPPANANMRRTFCQYSLFGWCFPIVLLLFSVFLQRETTGDLLAVESLKVSNCWFVGRDAFLYGYACPVLLLVAAISFGLARSALAARRSTVVRADGETREKANRKRKLQLCLYVKLTLFLTTGSLAALVFVLTRLESFWILFNVCQGVQGIFVALCVTCNCHVLKIYTKSLKKRRKRSRYGGVAWEPSKSASLQMLAQDPAPEAV
ncbi:UNVERIFIED_CONTAM: hypothetical protein PYX00_007851 [Menopon gallinae]|uniref:G-protein coupled receptors family 2 profile 2 domain-containing protein n=1 Tax=Menopon gallinae TaxID=328185 RepID=A0AAW2HKF5_9NEOP